MRILLCDDHRLFAEPLATVLERRGHEVVLTTSPAAAVQAVEQFRPDVCLIDLRFPDGDGIEAAAELRDRHPWCTVVVLSASVDERDVSAARAAGAAGFLHKDQPVAAVLDALDRIVAGAELTVSRRPHATGMGEKARVRRLLGHLTAREREVLRGLVRAEDTRAIARALEVAPSTARTHLQNVLVKLGVHNRLQAVALVVDMGMDGEL
jgi:two-component system, NarL family, nitrate/nitrite response regulator NarL